MKQMTFAEFLAAREEKEWRLIDVREQHEWDQGHAVGAEHFPLSKIRMGQLPEPDDRPVAIMCQSGGRSGLAGMVLENHGWSETVNIVDGIIGAVRAGHEHVERG